MRIRKRTPARAASPGAPPPLPLQQTMPREKPQEVEDKEAAATEEEEEKRAIPANRVRGGGDDDEDRVRPTSASASASASGNSSATDAVPKPEPEPQDAAAARCSRNDGKRWRCKRAAVPGYLFCDRHIAWSTRKRKPRASSNSKTKSHGSGVHQGPTTTPPKELAEDHDETTQRNAGFY